MNPPQVYISNKLQEAASVQLVEGAHLQRKAQIHLEKVCSLQWLSFL